jgi:lambda family phage portal protein
MALESLDRSDRSERRRRTFGDRIDAFTATIAPRWTLQRRRARYAGEILARHYEGAATSHRTSGWRKPATDANAAIGPGLAALRQAVRDLVRNNPYASSALAAIVNETIGWGIVPKSKNARVMALWRAWGETKACDADGIHDFYGLEKLALRTIAESGEVIIRRRFRLPGDLDVAGNPLPIPLQIQILEPDFLDTAKDIPVLPNGGRIVQGVEFSPIGQRVAYWLFREHPGAISGSFGPSVRIPATEILHLFRGERPGQVRAVSWFAPSLLAWKDLDDYDDATLVKQKIAACLAVFVRDDLDGTGAPIGDPNDAATPAVDGLTPGMVSNLPAGRQISVVEPPRVNDFGDYMDRKLRGLASGLRVLYEGMTGDYRDLSFSAARMSRLGHQPDVDDHRWRILIPGFCDPVFAWAMQAAAIAGLVKLDAGADVTWTPPPLPFIDPASEGLAILRNVRAGITTMQEELRARGLDPAEVLAEMKAWNEALDKAGVVLDSDPRRMTQAGQAQTATPTAPAQPSTPNEPAAAGAATEGGA